MNSEDSDNQLLKGRKILLGICGSIAAYKSAFLCREFIKAGAEVRVVMTRDASNFVGPVTFSTLSKNPVHIELSEEGHWSDHVGWGLWADLMIIAPLTANTLAKLACGITDNMLTATYLSARCPVMAAPAMDLDMWNHPSTVRNIKTLRSDGIHFLDVDSGELASGLSGPGRMMEPSQILENAVVFFQEKKSLSNIKALVTAGPTVEPIDPVRFISNYSSGKMGVAIANALASRGAEVHLIHGPISAELSIHPAVHRHPIKTADELLNKTMEIHPSVHLAVFAAAVSDYKPLRPQKQKIKKGNEKAPQLELTENPDIAARCGQFKKDGQYHLGFALETQNEEKNARKKLVNKNFDLILLNSLNDDGAGFEKDTNKVSFIEQNKSLEFELKTKVEIAEDLIDYLKPILTK